MNKLDFLIVRADFDTGNNSRNKLKYTIDLSKQIFIMTKNITDNYDSQRLLEVREILQFSPEPDGFFWTRLDSRRLVISMKDAIILSSNDDYKKRTNLTEQQKFLIAAIAEERKTEAGRFLTDSAAKEHKTQAGRSLPSQWLAADTNIPGFASAMYLSGAKLTLIDPNEKLKGDSYKSTLHHELTHVLQDITAKMPEDLSSFDQKLWHFGLEAQALLAQKDEEMRRQGKKLTDEEKRKIFSDMGGPKVSLMYQMNYLMTHEMKKKSTRDDGRKLTIEEYEKAFGFIPGHEKEGNFLVGGKYSDPADIMPDIRIPKKPILLKYSNLPIAAKGSDNARFEDRDKNCIITVSHKKGSDDAEVETYMRYAPGKDVYVSVDCKHVKVMEVRDFHDGKYSYEFEGSYSRSKKEAIFLGITVDIKRDGQITVNARGHSSLSHKTENFPFERHQNTLGERIFNSSIKDLPLPAPKQKPKPREESSLELPDHVKSVAQAAGELARACNPVAGGEAVIVQNNAYIQNPAVKTASIGGRES